MSIDAKINYVSINEDGSGRLYLIDRPARTGGVPGIAGQSTLWFDEAPKEVTNLNSLNIWGGSSTIMLGDVEIARRDGYTHIIFNDREKFLRGLSKYNN